MSNRYHDRFNSILLYLSLIHILILIIIVTTLFGRLLLLYYYVIEKILL